MAIKTYLELVDGANELFIHGLQGFWQEFTNVEANRVVFFI